MGSDRRNRMRRPARGTRSRSPKRRISIVCEGQVTEPEYFRGLQRWARNHRVEIVVDDRHGVPLTLVRRAERLKNDAESAAQREDDAFLAYDEVWCAFDVDAHPNLNDARQLADARHIGLAVSNPCFELWLWLHFREQPGARQRQDLQRMLGEYLSGYDKHLDFDLLAAGDRIADAIGRARRLHREAESDGEPGRNPSTGVYRLAESIAYGDESGC